MDVHCSACPTCSEFESLQADLLEMRKVVCDFAAVDCVECACELHFVLQVQELQEKVHDLEGRVYMSDVICVQKAVLALHNTRTHYSNSICCCANGRLVVAVGLSISFHFYY